jgi:hypothetical protein
MSLPATAAAKSRRLDGDGQLIHERRSKSRR